LTSRKSSTLQFLLVLQHFLQPLARLSKTLQSSTWNIASAVKATVSTFREDFSISLIKAQYDDLRKETVSAGVNVEKDTLSPVQQ